SSLPSLGLLPLPPLPTHTPVPPPNDSAAGRPALRVLILATLSIRGRTWATLGSELGSELTFLAGSELRTSELDTSELKTSEYRFLKIFILASYEQELCQFNFLLASCQLSSSELHCSEL
ncbi:hypothetical protein Tco_1115672, partial [Tanacetum coccineum]